VTVTHHLPEARLDVRECSAPQKSSHFSIFFCSELARAHVVESLVRPFRVDQSIHRRITRRACLKLEKLWCQVRTLPSGSGRIAR